ncbi:hypothetical protein [Yinghuangia sp. YIM S10712]|uniref:hypothetical protein n=1 Tax=Yinghuangia sp. YIM S10712 TaxID=3436930 RepID=UPI003F5386AB
MSDAIDPSDVPAWPVVVVELRTDGQVRVDGDMFAVPQGADVRQTAIAAVAATASLIGRPVRAEAREPDGTVWPLIVTPKGQAIAAGAARRTPPAAKRRGFRSGVLRRPSAPQPSAPPPPVATTADVAAASHPEPPQGPPVPLPPPAPRPPAAPVSPVLPHEPAPSSTSAPGSFPEPDDEARSALDRILAELRNKRLAAARSRAQALVDRLTEQRGRDNVTTEAAREVLAYTMFLAGDAARAARLYADLAAPRVAYPMRSDTDGARLADNAHFCWYRAGSSPDTQETGMRILALRRAGWGADSGPARTLQHRLAVGGKDE